MKKLITRDEPLHDGLTTLAAYLGDCEATPVAVGKRPDALNKANNVSM